MCLNYNQLLMFSKFIMNFIINNNYTNILLENIGTNIQTKSY